MISEAAPGEMVPASAAQSLPSTRARGQDDGSNKLPQIIGRLWPLYKLFEVRVLLPLPQTEFKLRAQFEDPKWKLGSGCPI